MKRNFGFWILRSTRAAVVTPTGLVAPAVFAGGPELNVIYGRGDFLNFPVPTLGMASLFVLALLLAVVALRAARHGRAGRAAAIALCSFSLIAGGVGVERTMATSSFYATSGGDCDTGGSGSVFLRDGNTFFNDCPNSLAILAYAFVNPGDTCDLIPNNSQVEPACLLNAVIPAGTSCALPVCE